MYDWRSTKFKIRQRVEERLERYLESQLDGFPLRCSLAAIASIYTAKYFTRVWIFQEIVLGKTNVCQYGDQLYSLAVLTAAAEVLAHLGCKKNNPRKPTSLNPECIEIDMGHMERITYSYLRPALQNSWLQIYTSRAHGFEVVTHLNEGTCSDAKDYIYGVASLFEESARYGINYSLSEAEVFSDFTAHCLSGIQGIDVLDQDRPTMESMAAHRDLRQGLPS